MKRIKCLGLLLAVFIFLAGALPAPAEDILTLEWVRSTKSEGKATCHSPMDPLTVDREGNVYVCNTDGYLYVYTPEKNLKWKVNLGQYSSNDWHLMGLGPVLDGEGNCYIASRSRKVYKIDSGGNVVREFLMAGEVADGTSPVLSADGGTLYVVTRSRILYALNSSDLSKKWQVQIKGGGNAISPVISPDGTVVVGSKQTVTAVTPGGEIKWEYTLPGDRERQLYQYWSQGLPNREKRMQVDGAGNIYFLAIVDTDGDGNVDQYRSELFCLRSDGTAISWQKPININVSEPALYGDTLYYCTADNRLHAVNTADGGDKWELYVDAEGTSLSDRAPAVSADGKIYFHMGTVVGVVRDDGGTGVLLGKCRLPNSSSSFVGNSPVSRLGPRGEFYVGYADVNYNYWLAKIVDNTFEPRPAAIEISPEEKNITMAVGGSYTPALTLRDTNGVAMDKGGLVFTSQNPAVISAAAGVLTARQAGTAAVTVTHPDNEDLTATINVTVLGSLSGSQLRIATVPLEVSIGQTLPLQAGLLAADGSTAIKGEALEWSSSNAAVAEVSADGQLKGMRAGSATVRVRLTNHPEIAASATATVRENIVRRVTLAEIKDKINRTVSYYKKGGAPGTDWAAFALNAVGEDLNTYVTNGGTYLDNLEARVKEPGYLGLMTDYERTVIGVVSAGGDPANFAADVNGENGMNLLEKIYNYPSLGQGINAAVFALVALDAANADIPANAVHSRESLISFILNNRVKEGWSYGGSEPDPDMTGMALYALAPYRDRPAVKEAGEAAIQWLSEAQDEDGTLKSWGTKNSESISQAIMGVTAWGVDPQGPMFTKQNGNLVTGLLGFYFEDSGMFGHLYGTPDPAMATDQGLEALAALQRYTEKGYSDIFYKIASVSSGPREITALEITPEGLEIPPGCQVRLQASDQSGRYVENDQVNWSSSNSAVASIDGTGLLTAHGPGNVQATATLQADGTVRDTVSLEVFGQDFETARVPDPANPFGVDRTVALEVKNVSGEKKTVVMIITLVNRDTGKMTHSSYVTREIAPGETAELAGGVNAPESGSYQVKTMLWNGWDKLRPLMTAVEQ
ncbi:MAG: Ig-like domain-containing protein [Peptococcaceae bacterium]|nr:Ig-like domain-containing protein [Peptococcaceae bacterium]